MTLADRRPNSFRSPSGLHESLLLFNKSPDICMHAHRIVRGTPLDLKMHMLFLWSEIIHSTFVTSQQQKPEYDEVLQLICITYNHVRNSTSQ